MSNSKYENINNQKVISQAYQETNLFYKFFQMIPGGACLTIDISCKNLIYNCVGAEFLRINPWENNSFSSEIKPDFKVFRKGIELKPEDMPIQRSAWFGEEITGDELVCIWPDGITKTSIWNTSPLRNNNGEIIGSLATFEDITISVEAERKLNKYRMKLEKQVDERTKKLELIIQKLNNEVINRLKIEQDLRKSNVSISCILESIADAFFVLDHQWRVIYINSKAEQLSSKTSVDVLGKTFWDVIPEARGTVVETNYHKVMNEQVPMKFEVLSVHQKGRWYEVSAFPSELGISVYYQDVTVRRLTQEKLQRSEELFTEILESISDSFISLDQDYKILYVNKGAVEFLGEPQNKLYGRSIFDIMYYLNPIARNSYYEVMRSRIPQSIELFSNHFTKWFEINYYPTREGLSVYFRDITDRKNTEKEIARLDRLDLIGQMAAGIGHEVRNPMTTVKGFLQMFGQKPEYLKAKEIFELMISELDRANSIITDFLSLANDNPVGLVVQQKNLNNIINRLEPLLTSDSFNCSMNLVFNLSSIPDLHLNEKEITQMILNLVRNGFEAMWVHRVRSVVVSLGIRFITI